MKESTCTNCEKKFSHANSTTGKYCSHRCQNDFQTKEVYRKIVACNGRPDGVGVRKMKAFLVDSRGASCVICSGSEWMGSEIPLVMDHVDGNSDNWVLENLRLICYNCDAQTPTYKNKNYGNGRHSRRERYAEGKSY